jgi:undecaprenyl phosphate N,N'-diacetylbacillosamine 1-phosphate transferase
VIYRRGGKRALDLAFSLIGLAILGPVILLGWLAVKLSSAGPGFLHQTRIGAGERPFRLHKLRTMTVDPGRVLTQTMTKDPDVLPVGRVLRRFKIDELPQFANVLAGEMSFVGPRPCMPVTAEEMPSWARRRFSVRPGMTGLAQVNGNAGLSWEERWRHDVAYVDRYSVELDGEIMLKTLGVVFFGEDCFRSAS